MDAADALFDPLPRATDAPFDVVGELSRVVENAVEALVEGARADVEEEAGGPAAE